MKVKAKEDKIQLEYELTKKAGAINLEVKEWKKRAKSIVDKNEIIKKNDIKFRYQVDREQVIRRKSIFDERIEKATRAEDIMMMKMQNTMQLQRRALNDLET